MSKGESEAVPEAEIVRLIPEARRRRPALRPVPKVVEPPAAPEARIEPEDLGPESVFPENEPDFIKNAFLNTEKEIARMYEIFEKSPAGANTNQVRRNFKAALKLLRQGKQAPKKAYLEAAFFGVRMRLGMTTTSEEATLHDAMWVFDKGEHLKSEEMIQFLKSKKVRQFEGTIGTFALYSPDEPSTEIAFQDDGTGHRVQVHVEKFQMWLQKMEGFELVSDPSAAFEIKTFNRDGKPCFVAVTSKDPTSKSSQSNDVINFLAAKYTTGDDRKNFKRWEWFALAWLKAKVAFVWDLVIEGARFGAAAYTRKFEICTEMAKSKTYRSVLVAIGLLGTAAYIGKIVWEYKKAEYQKLNEIDKEAFVKYWNGWKLWAMASLYWADVTCLAFTVFEHALYKWFEIGPADSSRVNIKILFFFHSFFGPFRETECFKDLMVNLATPDYALGSNPFSRFFNGAKEAVYSLFNEGKVTHPLAFQKILNCINRHLFTNPVQIGMVNKSPVYRHDTSLGISDEFLERYLDKMLWNVPALIGRLDMCLTDVGAAWAKWKIKRERKKRAAEQRADAPVIQASAAQFGAKFEGVREETYDVYYGAPGPIAFAVDGKPNPKTEGSEFPMRVYINDMVQIEQRVFVPSVVGPPDEAYAHAFSERTYVVDAKYSSIYELDLSQTDEFMVNSNFREAGSLFIESQFRFRPPNVYLVKKNSRCVHPIREEESGVFAYTRLMLTHAIVQPTRPQPQDELEQRAKKLDEYIRANEQEFTQLDITEKHAIAFSLVPEMMNMYLMLAVKTEGRTDLS